MGRLPFVSGADAVKTFVKAGWRVDRQRGRQVEADSRSNYEQSLEMGLLITRRVAQLNSGG